MPLFADWPEHYMDLPTARRLLEPHAPQFNAAWDHALTMFNGTSDQFRAATRAVTRANIMHDHSSDFLRTALGGVPGITFCERLGFFKIYVENEHGDVAVVRNKHLDLNYLASNVKTEQQQRWYAHDPMEDIRNEATRLTIGYTLNPTQTEIDDVIVSLQHFDDLVYYFSLRNEGNIYAAPVMAPPDGPPLVGPVVRPAITPRRHGTL